MRVSFVVKSTIRGRCAIVYLYSIADSSGEGLVVLTAEEEAKEARWRRGGGEGGQQMSSSGKRSVRC
ncbi:hypothetical protein RB195_016698 [Necator americanus]|uniref:Uncharacterized protein n=1 Tax=Necator americanus TaxID=51031 RepID=A0ABR1C1N9_NECAM